MSKYCHIISLASERVNAFYLSQIQGGNEKSIALHSRECRAENFCFTAY
ncbi:hypothetical protein POREN0001_1625 [Porphyromonas endodontalis ATCC 35406]|uniref:Uncharacterized protein n=1 Tax=Porphyromonas endodontalis (strain ATCC 35406 / DSM 24491 / JCM 8526 / CCUG 16442 / BCRC 14492 / NCTC 13058 / HG 370) TaxID=553175 RepID=C3JCK9_POREA|nr:hypothetical protein POREN0001_1625 [Porphyromonas endodontalis ATCC 35406]